jgi:hypothetical protein
LKYEKHWLSTSSDGSCASCEAQLQSIQLAMTDLVANLFVDVHLSKAKLIFFLECNCFLIASSASVYSLQQMLLRVLADGNTNVICNALNNH